MYVLFWGYDRYSSQCSIIIITDARKLADTHCCKYIETSVALNHQVDELLVGILRQIRLSRNKKSPQVNPGSHPKPKVKRSGALGLLDRLFSRKAKSGSTCDNLYDVWPNSILFQSWLCCRLDNILQTRQIKKEAKTFSKIINLQITAVACNTKNCFMRFSSIYSYSEMGHWDDFSRIHYNSLEM